MCSILCLEQMHFLSFANFAFVITKPNLCVISNDSNSLASLKEIEKIPSPVWAQCQQKQSQHLGKRDPSKAFTLCTLGARGTAKRCGLFPLKGELSSNSSAGVVVKPEDSHHHVLYGLLCNSGIIALKKIHRSM